jgi:hypothetical protein
VLVCSEALGCVIPGWRRGGEGQTSQLRTKLCTRFHGVHRCGHKLLIVAVEVGSIAYLNPQLVKVIFEGVG